MKNTLSILTLIVLGSCSASSQNNTNTVTKEDTVITISGEAKHSGSCSRKCIRISNVNVQLDNCYDEDMEAFSKDCEEDLKDKTLYTKLLNTDVSYWQQIETEIDNNHDADAGLPFMVTVTKNGETNSFILLRIDEYPTKEYAEFMNQLEALFDNWRDCPHDSK